MQVSAALTAEPDEFAALASFDEPIYLHQTVARRKNGDLVRFEDLPDFLLPGQEDLLEARVHFHVPVSADRIGACGTTRFFLDQVLPMIPVATPLEVETYSWSALPSEERQGDIVD